MATITPTTVTSAGVVPSGTAVAAGGDQFLNTGNNMSVQIVNSSGANTYTVTFATSQTYLGFALADEAWSIGTSETRIGGLFEIAAFNDTNGYVQVTYAGSAPATDLTIQVFTWT